MQAELQVLKKQLAEMLNKDKDLKSALKEVNRGELIKAALLARNPRFESVDIDGILAGQLQKDVPVGDYLFIQNFTEIVDMAYAYLEMGNSLDRNLLVAAARKLTEDDSVCYRRNNPVIYSLNHVPPHYSEIDRLLTEMFKIIYSKSANVNVVSKAMFIHNSIISIQPFPEYSGEIAIFAMNYYLMEQGLMPVVLSTRRDDYMEMVADCIKGKKEEVFYNFLFKNIEETMHRTIDACADFIES